jgi:hypothetical protein
MSNDTRDIEDRLETATGLGYLMAFWQILTGALGGNLWLVWLAMGFLWCVRWKVQESGSSREARVWGVLWFVALGLILWQGGQTERVLPTDRDEPRWGGPF